MPGHDRENTNTRLISTNRLFEPVISTNQEVDITDYESQPQGGPRPWTWRSRCPTVSDTDGLGQDASRQVWKDDGFSFVRASECDGMYVSSRPDHEGY
jgi:hypothetical protein